MKKNCKKKYFKDEDTFFDQNDDLYLMLKRGELNKEIYNFWKALSK